MEIDDVILREYYRCIRRQLCCPRNQKKAVLAYIQNSVQNFLSENPEANMDDLVTAIGTPMDIVNSYFAGLEPEEIRESLKLRKRILQIIAGAAAVALVAWVTVIIIALNTHMGSMHGYFEMEVIQTSTANMMQSITAGNE